MAKTEEVWTQLATRIPKELHRRLKLHCVTNGHVGDGGRRGGGEGQAKLRF